ncbi:MAG TPA: TauD/TfdA family dioxygenase [Burkholderiaceae bacterium]|nr:TauD/TfdA family dioxygenase [Burkholderiaceae bacterium]
MAIDLHPVTPDFAAEVGDVDLSQPLAPEVLAQIQQAFWTYSVLVFPDQKLTAEQHLAFARHFGPHETSIGVYSQAMPRRVPTQLADVSNLDDEARPWGRDSRQRMFQLGNRLWHTDSSFKYLPALASALYARSIPPVGGHTEFADLRAAYEALPAARRAGLEGLVAEHSIFCSRAKLGFTDFSATERQALPPVPQMLVRTIPQTGRRTLYLASHASHILGMPLEQGRALLAELIEHATQRRFVYTHRWRLHDVVMWDNRCTMHRGTGFDDLRWPRDMQRATVSDIANSCEQAGVEPLMAAG